ncbi:hypothetical protein B0H13DRAFT_2323262 [Mycena leptocephala]|nr:hypothetical protein B0H13DRAFT_2323262 [Mycena leptocephala]
MPASPGSANNPLQAHHVLTPARSRDFKILVSPPPKLCIFGSPPSTIRQDARLTRSQNRAATSQPYPPGLLGDATQRDALRRRARREARDLEDHAAFRVFAIPTVVINTSSARTRVRAPQPPDPGWHKERDEPLTVESVLLTQLSPPAMTTDHAHQTCRICLQIKSHPVAYRCGHSHCYRCIRVWLEDKWTCPVCRATMHMAPCRHYGVISVHRISKLLQLIMLTSLRSHPVDPDLVPTTLSSYSHDPFHLGSRVFTQ